MDTVSVDESLPPEVQEAIQAGIDEVETPLSTKEETHLGIAKPTGDLVRITHIDYKQPVHAASGPTDCGDTTAYKKLSHVWAGLPVLFHIDTANLTGGVDLAVAKAAVVNSFATWDNQEHPAGSFFAEGVAETALIKVRWALIDGPGGTLAYAQTTYNRKTRKAVKADVVFDSGDTWNVYGSVSCAGQGDPDDIENVGTHEIGHVIGLGHTTTTSLNRSATMYPYILTSGETNKRTLSTGDKAGMDALY
jgi:hypothetical protein